MLLKNMKFVLLALGLMFSVAVNAQSVNNLLHRSTDPIAGNPNGKITVVEFFDYQCSHCANMAPIVSNIIKSNPNVRFVFKDFPIRGPLSTFAARAAIAANKQGKYYPLSHALLSTNLSLSDGVVFELAKSVGINVAQLKKDMDNSSVNDELQSTEEVAKSFDINGTPAFFIGKSNATNSSDLNFVLGEMSESELQDAINKANS